MALGLSVLGLTPSVDVRREGVRSAPRVSSIAVGVRAQQEARHTCDEKHALLGLISTAVLAVGVLVLIIFTTTTTHCAASPAFVHPIAGDVLRLRWAISPV